MLQCSSRIRASCLGRGQVCEILIHNQIPLEKGWVAGGIKDRGRAFGVGILRATASKILNSTIGSDVLAPIELIVERYVGKGRMGRGKDPR
jgi:hypothetical protein